MEQAIQTGDKVPNHDYAEVQASVRETFATRMATYGPHLFATKSDGLSTRYVLAFPQADQQHHNCNACRDFIRRFGHAVFIDEAGYTIPALWDHTTTPEHYAPAIKALEDAVGRNSVRGQFFTPETTWGHEEKNGWLHLAVNPSLSCTSIVPELNLGAEKGDAKEMFDLLQKAVDAYPLAVAKEAVTHLRSEAANKTRDFASQAEWFAHFLIRLQRAEGHVGRTRNLILREVATCVPRSWLRIGTTVIGNMMDDIKEGMHIDTIIGRFNAQTRVNTYQKTTAPVTENQVEVARRTFANLGLGVRDLKRRLATLDELLYIWRPATAPVEVEAEEVLFGAVSKKIAKSSAVPTNTADGGKITWARFSAEILPKAEKMLVHVGQGGLPLTFYTTAAEDDSKPLFFYDQPEKRNPLCWFIGLDPQTGAPTVHAPHVGVPYGFQEVYGVAGLPVGWTGGDRGKQYDGVVLMLANSTFDSCNMGAAIHTMLLRDDLRDCRRVIEDNNQHGRMEQLAQTGNAIGLRIDTKGMTTQVMVTDAFGTTRYHIDRMA